MAEAHAARVGTPITDALKMSGLDMADIDSVILAGGGTRTPFVQKALEKVVGSAEKLRSNVNADEAAVFGAGFRAAGLSPSFRVKEIRASEGSSYPMGMKWTGANGKEQTQRLWSPVSPLGGPAKEFTFTEENDFVTTFYQQVGDEYRDVKSFTTKNLTATVAAVKEKYPSCVDSGIFFRVGAKLSGENGEVQIVKAAVECEAEAKEGLMDGVKNLFGFGKKDQEPLKDDGENGETETVGSEQASSSEADASTTASSAETSQSGTAEGENGSTEEMKDVKKTELVSIPVDFATAKLGIPQLTKEQLTKSKDRLKAFAASDKARVQREEALNLLEGYTYKIRDLVADEGFVAVSSETERKVLSEKASEASEWIYDDGAEAPKDVLKARLKELQDLVTPIQKRKEEAEKRPEELTKLKQTLDQTFTFVDGMRKQIDDYEAWHASASASAAEASTTTEQAAEASKGEFDGLEDDAELTKRTMDDVLEERGPVPPLYKREDLAELEELAKATRDWLQEAEPKQDALPSTADPVLLVKDISARRVKIEVAGKDLALKGVKNFDSKKKKGGDKKKDKKKDKESKTAGGDPAQQTIKVGNKEYSPEEIEEMINGMTEEDWKKVEEQIAKQNAGQQGEKTEKNEEEPKHDEL